MKRFINYAHLCVLFIFLTCSIRSLQAISFEEAIVPLKDFFASNEPFALSDFFDVNSILMPDKLKNALERVHVEERTFVVDPLTKSADLRFSAEVFGQKIVFKLRMGLEFPGPQAPTPSPAPVKKAYARQSPGTLDLLLTTVDIETMQPEDIGKEMHPRIVGKDRLTMEPVVQDPTYYLPVKKNEPSISVPSEKWETKTQVEKSDDESESDDEEVIAVEAPSTPESLTPMRVVTEREKEDESDDELESDDETVAVEAPSTKDVTEPSASMRGVITEREKTDDEDSDDELEAEASGQLAKPQAVQEEEDEEAAAEPATQAKPPKKQISDLFEAETIQSSIGKSLEQAQAGVQVVTKPKQTIADLKAMLKSADFKFSLLIGLPQGFSFGAIDPRLKILDLVQFKKYFLVVSQNNYREKEWNLSISKGINVIGTVKIAGPLERVADLIGERLTEVTIQGLIDPKVFGSQLSAQLPGKLRLGKNLQTTGLTLSLFIKEALPGVPSIAVSIKTGLQVTMPNQVSPLLFTGEATVSPEKASLDFYMTGMWENVFGIPGPKIGNVKFKATIDYMTAAATEGILALSGIGLGGEMGFGKKSIAMNVYGEISTTADVLLEGELKGGIYLADVVDFGMEVVGAAAKLEEKVTAGKSHEIDTKLQAFKKLVKDRIPDLGYEYVHMYIVPKVMFFGGKKYSAGITLESITHILGVRAAMNLSIDKGGIVGGGSLSPITLGPISITASKEGQALAPQNAIIPTGGPSVKLSLKPKQFTADLVIDGRIQADILGGLSGEARIDLSPIGVIIRFNSSIFNQFNSEFEINAKLTQLNDLQVKAQFDQQGLSNLSQLLERAAGELLATAPREIEKARRAVEQAQNAVDKAQDELSKIRERRVKIEQENRKNIDRVRQKVLRELDDINESKRELDRAIDECKGKAPEFSQKEIEEAAIEQQPSPQEVEKMLQEFKKEGLNDEQIELIRAQIR